MLFDNVIYTSFLQLIISKRQSKCEITLTYHINRNFSDTPRSKGKCLVLMVVSCFCRCGL